MVEEVVGSIIEAEDKAEQMGREAAEEAKRILSDARLASETGRAACAKDCRAQLAAKRREAEQKAEAVYAQAMGKGRQEADALRAAQAKNRQKAVAVILSAVLN